MAKRFIPRNHYRVQAVGSYRWGVYHLEDLKIVFTSELRPDALDEWGSLVQEEEKNRVREPRRAAEPSRKEAS